MKRLLCILLVLIVAGCLSAVSREERFVIPPTRASASGQGRQTSASRLAPAATRPSPATLIIRIGDNYYGAVVREGKYHLTTSGHKSVTEVREALQ